MISNAKITKTFLGKEDHGIMTFFIYIESGCTGCAVGGWALDEYDRKLKQRVCVPKSFEAITRILDVVGVDKWEDLPGKYIRFEDNGWGSIVEKIGNIIEDKWFDMRAFFSEEEKK